MNSLEQDFWKAFDKSVWSGYKVIEENGNTISLEITTIDGYKLIVEYNKLNGSFTYSGKPIS
jgi:hypothetical protein